MDKAQEEFMSLLKYDKFCQSLKMILKFSNNVGNGESYLGTCFCSSPLHAGCIHPVIVYC